MRPYYQDEWVTIYNGDAREILPGMSDIEIITDPVWPGANTNIPGADRPYSLFKEFCQALPRSTRRLVIQLGCDSDPRFLKSLPAWLPFLRICSLEYTIPSYKGRILNTGDFAYVFGQSPRWREDRQLMPGVCRSNYVEKLFQKHNGKHKIHEGRAPAHITAIEELPHPCTRRLQHLYWLVHYFSDDLVVDPFMGSGTTIVAAKYLNRKSIGIEIEEKYCRLAVERLSQSVMDLCSITPPPDGKQSCLKLFESSGK
ncbi:MAG: DNA methyltransferase [Dehalococcoidales bacterium]|jgi:site-specific DNA-methyltransferase (adenine-specific)|nr:DNA methyltransferase [Dehalococcoidales bacterium]